MDLTFYFLTVICKAVRVKRVIHVGHSRDIKGTFAGPLGIATAVRKGMNSGSHATGLVTSKVDVITHVNNEP